MDDSAGPSGPDRWIFRTSSGCLLTHNPSRSYWFLQALPWDQPRPGEASHGADAPGMGLLPVCLTSVDGGMSWHPSQGPLSLGRETRLAREARPTHRHRQQWV